jgi:hypothetical protein
LHDELEQSKKEYQQNIILALFDFITIAGQCKELVSIVKDNAAAFNTELLQWVSEIEHKMLAVQAVAEKFKQQLRKLFRDGLLAETNSALQERLTAGATYFIGQIDDVLQLITTSPATTDSKQTREGVQ